LVPIYVCTYGQLTVVAITKVKTYGTMLILSTMLKVQDIAGVECEVNY
jgi:hypothetical protein